jgi:hypothetical protein
MTERGVIIKKFIFIGNGGRFAIGSHLHNDLSKDA